MTPQEAIKRIEEFGLHHAIRDLPHSIYTVEAFEMAIKVLSAQSEIIYCKDCKHWMPYDWMFSEVWRSVNMDDYSEDEIGCAYCDMNMSANDFCSRAERKNND